MSWARYDDEFPMNRKVIKLVSEGQAGLAAIGLHLLANTWSRHNGTAGIIEAHVPGIIAGAAGKRAAKLLAEVGMFDVIEGGYAIHDFAEYHDPNDPEPNKSAADRKKELSEKRAEAGRRGGQAKAKQSQGFASVLPGSKTEANGWQTSSPDPVPDPVPPVGSTATTHHRLHGAAADDDVRFAPIIEELVDGRVAKFPSRSNAFAYRSKITAQITADYGDVIREYLATHPDTPADLAARRMALDIA